MKPALPLGVLVLASLVLVTAALGLAALPTLGEQRQQQSSELEPAATVEPDDNLMLSFDGTSEP